MAQREAAQAIIANLYSAPLGTPPTPQSHRTTIRAADGSWVVMDYRDSHDGLAPDEIADALCSDRTWLQSGEHYCAYFGHIDALPKELAKPQELREMMTRSSGLLTLPQGAETSVLRSSCFRQRCKTQRTDY